MKYIRIDEYESFTIGFELGWFFLDLMLGYYKLGLGTEPNINFIPENNEGENNE